MTEQWVVVHTAAGALQAEIIRGLLEAADIPARTRRESAGAVYALTVGPLGEVEVLVAEAHQAAALEVIRAYEHGELESPGNYEEGSGLQVEGEG